MFEFAWCNIAGYFITALSFEIFIDKLTIILRKIVVHIFQGRIIVTHHHIRVFSNNMYLLHPQLIEHIQSPILFLSISGFAIHLSAQLHSVVYHHEPSLNLHHFVSAEIQHSLSYIRHCGFAINAQMSFIILVKDIYDRKRN